MNRSITQTISIILAISLMAALASCKSHDATNFESNTKHELIEFIDGNVGQVVSISVVNAENTYQYHFGTLSNGDTPNNQTIYELGSLTKTYTGLVVAEAILEGKVELDKDIRHYLKGNEYKNLELSNQYITLQHLLTHTSGLPRDFAVSREDIEQGRYFEKISKYSTDDYFDDLKKVKLSSTPGEDYLYSSVGTNLVGYILESVYQKPFELLVSEKITSKSGERGTKFRRTNFEVSEVTVGTDGNGNQMPLASAYWFASGGLTSDVDSVTRYMQHQLSSEPEVAISHQILDESWTGHGSAFYWYTTKDDSNELMLYQSGGSMGTSSWLAIYPSKNVGIFIVTNVAGDNTQPKLEVISDKVFDYLMAYNKASKSDA
ncbi:MULTISPECIES: serine hydrolase domain-containing protein [unclassified Pseudoalteromonas]|uniref:serine hydrolase domain-containing protein n=1 Tax=unclassified Pseudoalteromonas TaxID=194690 RepID=UPI002097A3D2|nr:serine hydrolase domain-containing protein [Pseudoalteromonas sp. XMcav2-N]MCO7191199.1 beta-lactamase family protein [Pseudoalteromonas sp. XMcav2-N]